MNDAIVEIILNYGTTDGAHHKMWLIDQILRITTGDTYETIIKAFEASGDYKWDIGIAP